MQRGLRIREDRGKWLIDLVRNCTGKLSQGRNPNQVRYFLALECCLGLRDLLFRDVNKNTTQQIQSAALINIRMGANSNPARLAIEQNNTHLTADAFASIRCVAQSRDRELAILGVNCRQDGVSRERQLVAQAKQ